MTKSKRVPSIAYATKEPRALTELHQAALWFLKDTVENVSVHHIMHHTWFYALAYALGKGWVYSIDLDDRERVLPTPLGIIVYEDQGLEHI